MSESIYDIYVNFDAWSPMGIKRTISNPNRSFWNLWEPKLLTQDLYAKTTSAGESVYVWYCEHRGHVMVESTD